MYADPTPPLLLDCTLLLIALLFLEGFISICRFVHLCLGRASDHQGSPGKPFQTYYVQLRLRYFDTNAIGTLVTRVVSGHRNDRGYVYGRIN